MGTRTTLIKRELDFCRFVFEGKKLRQSAIDAGYAPKFAHVTANKLMRKPKMKAELQRLRDEAQELTFRLAAEAIKIPAVMAMDEAAAINAAADMKLASFATYSYCRARLVRIIEKAMGEGEDYHPGTAIGAIIALLRSLDEAQPQLTTINMPEGVDPVEQAKLLAFRPN